MPSYFRVTPTTPKGQRFTLELNAENNKDAPFSLGDGGSFVFADDDKPLPLSPISPMTRVSAKVPASYVEPELDTSIFDTISHVSGVPPPRGVSLPSTSRRTRAVTLLRFKRSNADPLRVVLALDRITLRCMVY
jgi:hypothetical protein